MMRRSAGEDLARMQRLFNAAFAPSIVESALIKIVFQMDEEHHGWVFEERSELLACILFTRAYHGHDHIGYHLAPVAVHPDHQGRGIGGELIRESLRQEPICSSSVFVLGDPSFYERFGFGRINQPVCPYDPSNEHFRALRWKETATAFTIGYPSAFKEAEQTVTEGGGQSAGRNAL